MERGGGSKTEGLYQPHYLFSLFPGLISGDEAAVSLRGRLGSSQRESRVGVDSPPPNPHETLSCPFCFPFVLDGIYFQKCLCDPAPCSSGSPPCTRFSGHRQETGCRHPSSDLVLEGLRPLFYRSLPDSCPGPREATRRTARFTAKKNALPLRPHWRPVTCSTC